MRSENSSEARCVRNGERGWSLSTMWPVAGTTRGGVGGTGEKPPKPQRLAVARGCDSHRARV